MYTLDSGMLVGGRQMWSEGVGGGRGVRTTFCGVSYREFRASWLTAYLAQYIKQKQKIDPGPPSIWYNTHLAHLPSEWRKSNLAHLDRLGIQTEFDHLAITIKNKLIQ